MSDDEAMRRILAHAEELTQRDRRREAADWERQMRELTERRPAHMPALVGLSARVTGEQMENEYTDALDALFAVRGFDNDDLLYKRFLNFLPYFGDAP